MACASLCVSCGRTWNVSGSVAMASRKVGEVVALRGTLCGQRANVHNTDADEDCLVDKQTQGYENNFNAHVNALLCAVQGLTATSPT